MYSDQEKLKQKRQKYIESQPQIKLYTCRVESPGNVELKRFIIEGDPVLLGVVLPKIEIGGLIPLRIVASVDGKLAVGIVKGIPGSSKVFIDYGFTKDSCEIEDAAFSKEDSLDYERINKRPVFKKSGNTILGKIINFFRQIFRLFLNIK